MHLFSLLNIMVPISNGIEEPFSEHLFSVKNILIIRRTFSPINNLFFFFLHWNDSINVNERSMPIKKLYFKECEYYEKHYDNQVSRKVEGFSLTRPQNNNFSTAESNRVPGCWLDNEVKGACPEPNAPLLLAKIRERSLWSCLVMRGMNSNHSKITTNFSRNEHLCSL